MELSTEPRSSAGETLKAAPATKLRLYHVPLLLLYLGGVCLFMLTLVSLALLIEVFAVLAAVLLIVAVSCICVPLLVLAAGKQTPSEPR